MKPSNLLRFVFITLTFTLLLQCKPAQKKQINPLDFAEHVISFGPKSPSKMDEIYIGLDKSKFQSLTKEILQENFSISPKIEGEISLRDDDIVVFNPTNPLKSNQSYTVSLKLNKLVLNQENLKAKTFSFNLKTVPQNAQLSVKDIYTVDEKWYAKLKINLNDQESVETIKKSLAVNQDNKELAYNLTKKSPFEMEAVVEGIDMSKSNSSLKFLLKKNLIDLANDVKTSFDLPDPNKFELVKVVSDIEKSSFVFSKILDKNQNLNGLIKFDDQSKSPKYKIDGNLLLVFHESKIKEVQKITISDKLTSKSGMKLSAEIAHSNDLSPIKPKLKNVGVGHILPNSKEVIFPFEAQGLKSVQLEVFKIYTDNLKQFYQQNSLSNYYGLEYVGEVVHSQQLSLKDLSNKYDVSEMNRYYFNLKDFISKDENAIYEIRLGFTPQDAVSPCAADLDYDPELSTKSIFESNYYGIAGRYDGFDWNDRDNPCKLGYYGSNKYLSRLILASNLGIIVKKANNGDLQVIVNDLVTSWPVSNAEVEIFNKAQKSLLISKTDKRGFLKADQLEDAYLVKVNKNKDENWIRIENRDAISTSKFNVAGRTKKNGIDGYIYGERNIWRPGDSMYIDFILFDPQDKLPESHPVKLILENAQGKTVFSKNSSSHNGPIYPFVVPTKREFITGDYILHAQVGGNRFSKFIKIENIKPNKFSIKSDVENMDLSESRNAVLGNGKNIDFEVMWLYGAPAKNKRLQVQLNIENASTKFEDFPDFQFTDPKNNWSPPGAEVIADARTNDSGKANVKLKIESNTNPKGKLNLKFKNTAYEDSGDFSVESFNSLFSPFASYAGIKLPKDEYNYERAFKDQDATIRLASVSEMGKPLNNRKLKVEIYKMENYWWYNRYNDEFDMTNMSSHVSQYKFTKSTNSKGFAEITTQFRTHGRYYIQVCDQVSGHCTGDYLYVGYAWDDDEMSTAQYEEAAQLSLNPVKSSYKVGETVELMVPSYFEGQALVSLENGDKIVESFWTQVRRGNNKIEFTSQLEMFPTVYAHVTLLQEHAAKANDMPIRLYGVVPIQIEDNSLKLNPTISMLETLKPKDKFEVKIKEDNKKEMYYTLAIVEEGLLNISSFKTPDPFNHFYSRPSLGVRTFDMYNEVLSAYGTELSSLLSIGGDMENINLNEDTRANRFRPVVQHLGPFYLGSGAQNTHQIELPNYIGSVRVMVVAADQTAFGNAQKQVPVKQDLMLLATLPRSLAPGDEMDLPISLFTMKNNIGKIDFGVELESDYLNFENSANSVEMNTVDERMEKMKMKVGSKEGIAKLGFYAKSAGNLANQEIEIDVRNPNPVIRRTDIKYIKAGQTFEWTGESIGNNSELISSASSLAPINVEDHIKRLTRYPYGCLEQRTSAAIAMLFKPDLLKLNEIEKNYSKTVVNDLINDLYRFSNTEGYGLWPSNGRYNNWLSSYVGDFMFLAKARGYQVPESTMEHWKSTQSDNASSWSIPVKSSASSRRYYVTQQAYRLYTLAENGNSKINEMNRLKEDHVLDITSNLLLAAAYAKAGRKDIAEGILNNINYEEDLEKEFDRRTYRTYPRDLALQIILLDELGQKEKIAPLGKALTDWLAKNRYMSTHTSAFVLRAVGVLAKQYGDSRAIQISYKQDNRQEQVLSSETGIISVQSEISGSSRLEIRNNTDKGLYLSITRSGKEPLGQEKSNSSKLKIETKYLDMAGNKIDPNAIEQGVDLRVRTIITRPSLPTGSYSDLALRQIFPSGWEITNNRIYNINDESTKELDYQDYQDNQVNSFFSLENKNNIVIDVLVKATYQGSFYHPKMICESMYEDDVYAELDGFACQVY